MLGEGAAPKVFKHLIVFINRLYFRVHTCLNTYPILFAYLFLWGGGKEKVKLISTDLGIESLIKEKVLSDRNQLYPQREFCLFPIESLNFALV